MTPHPMGTHTSPRVLVLDGNSHAGLAVVRSLGQRNVSVTAGSSRCLPLSSVSRYCDNSHVYPNPVEDCQSFVTQLIDYLMESDHDIVIPVVDRTSVLLAKHKTEIEQTDTTVAIEDWETFNQTYDKRPDVQSR